MTTRISKLCRFGKISFYKFILSPTNINRHVFKKNNLAWKSKQLQFFLISRKTADSSILVRTFDYFPFLAVNSFGCIFFKHMLVEHFPLSLVCGCGLLRCNFLWQFCLKLNTRSNNDYGDKTNKQMNSWFGYTWKEKEKQKIGESHGLVQGRPTRGPRAIFGPPRLFEWPGKDLLKMFKKNYGPERVFSL
jgi:hypothetical protein